MRRISIALITIFVVLAIALIAAVHAWRTKGIALFLPTPSPAQLYPPAPPMPAVIADSADHLLAKYEQIIKERSPALLAALQPGLTDAEIDALESKDGFKLPADLRALYRWHNGAAPSATTADVFPDHRFIPLDQAIANRDSLRKQVKSGTSAEQRVYATFAGHRDPWLGLIVDPAGDGYFFDPARTEPQGSFFFCFAEDGSYVFFPAFRNYLAAVIQGIQSGTFTFGTLGAETKDFEKAQALFLQFGAANQQQSTP
jgi:cell wall assembly regulator SMI1